MSIVSPSYSGAATAVTITLAGLTNTSYRQSTAVDNTTTKYLDVIITGKITTLTGGSATGVTNFYLYGWDGTQYSNNATGSDASFTPDAQANLLLLYTLSTPTAAATYYLPPIQVAAFTGLSWIPQKWGIIVQNAMGATFNATGGNFVVEYQGINLSVQ